VRTASRRIAVAALLAFAVYSIFVVAVALWDREGHDVVFWASIVVIFLLAAAAMWAARWVWNRRPAQGQ
jgi:hypothetical protein